MSLSKEQAATAYWKENLRLMLGLLAVWFAVSFGAGILFVEQLNAIQFFGFPLGFWFAQQGLPELARQTLQKQRQGQATGLPERHHTELPGHQQRHQQQPYGNQAEQITAAQTHQAQPPRGRRRHAHAPLPRLYQSSRRVSSMTPASRPNTSSEPISRA